MASAIDRFVHILIIGKRIFSFKLLSQSSAYFRRKEKKNDTVKKLSAFLAMNSTMNELKQ